MSKEFKNTDDLFQSVFTDESADVPAFIKVNIDKRISGRKRRGIYFFFGALILLVSVGLTFIYAGRETSDQTANQNEGNTSDWIIADNTTDSGESSETAVPQLETGDAAQEQGDPSSSSHATGSNESTAGQSTQPDRSAGTTGNPGAGDKGNGVASLQPADENSNGARGVSTENQNEQVTTGERVYSEQNMLAVEGADVREKESLESDSLMHGATEMSTPAAILRPGIEHPMPDGIEEEKKYNPWMIGAEGGINLARSLYASPVQNEALLYEDCTNDAPGSSINLDVKYRFNNSLTFGSGVGMTRFIENYYFYKEANLYDSSLIVTYIYDSLDTTNVFPIDSIVVVEVDTLTEVVYNQTGTTKASYVHIPVSIGTQIIRNKFRFDLYVAARFNLLVNSGGGYIDGNTFVAFSKANSIFKPFYVDLLLGANVHYNIVDRLYGSLSLSYRPPISSMYRETTFNRSIGYTHLGIGLSWKF